MDSVDKQPKLRKMDMRFRLWNVRNLYRPCLPMAVLKELGKVQEARWDSQEAGIYTFFYGKGNENHQLCIDFCVHKRILLTVKRVEFVSDGLEPTHQADSG
jgi:hypothetical protein